MLLSYVIQKANEQKTNKIKKRKPIEYEEESEEELQEFDKLDEKFSNLIEENAPDNTEDGNIDYFQIIKNHRRKNISSR